MFSRHMAAQRLAVLELISALFANEISAFAAVIALGLFGLRGRVTFSQHLVSLIRFYGFGFRALLFG